MKACAGAFIILGLIALFGPAQAGAPRVVASIKPVHSLVSAVMQGAGEPGLLVGGSGSPHAYALRPSEARALSRADIVFLGRAGLRDVSQKAFASVGVRCREHCVDGSA